jgi:hypothetical protein
VGVNSPSRDQDDSGCNFRCYCVDIYLTFELSVSLHQLLICDMFFFFFFFPVSYLQLS